jgi:hypothetical protein
MSERSQTGLLKNPDQGDQADRARGAHILILAVPLVEVGHDHEALVILHTPHTPNISTIYSL